ncbi:hypothetical protein [Paracidovorax konjaci]|uniref:Uncharacterized protein n=1 Tax=Paracidovorax konjaci TaxID=32040 RepID=A0A1I1WKP8_9BURK|nr:hypothetical protein [Paracidovorax konjaci]SFD95652.1 hypothetical protein SAMN04489710_11028 [Paracidovorax konjaci]
MHAPWPRAPLPRSFRSLRFLRFHCFSLSRAALPAALALVAAVPTAALAQPAPGPSTAPSAPADAARADAATAPPRHAALPPWPGEGAPIGWRDAHAAVAEFPRGHADIVAWEARQGARSPARPPAAVGDPAAPGNTAHPAGHHHPGEHRP